MDNDTAKWNLFFIWLLVGNGTGERCFGWTRKSWDSRMAWGLEGIHIHGVTGHEPEQPGFWKKGSEKVLILGLTGQATRLS